MWHFLRSLIDTLLPPHADAALARAIADDELAELMQPRTLPTKPWVHVLWPYHDARVRAVIKAVKYYGEAQVAARVGVLAADYLLDVIADLTTLQGWRNVVLVPVPSSSKRLRERGYNQAARIAQAIAKNCDGVTYDESLLAREERVSQVRVMRSRRGANIKGAFYAPHPELVKNKFIILIDDVVESGATLTDARRALLAAGARDVIALALAH